MSYLLFGIGVEDFALLYRVRKDAVDNSDIKLSLEEFFDLYCCLYYIHLRIFFFKLSRF